MTVHRRTTNGPYGNFPLIVILYRLYRMIPKERNCFNWPSLLLNDSQRAPIFSDGAMATINKRIG